MAECLTDVHTFRLEDFQCQLDGSVFRGRQPTVSHFLNQRRTGSDALAGYEVVGAILEQLRHTFANPSFRQTMLRVVRQKLYVLLSILVTGKHGLAVHLNVDVFVFCHFAGKLMSIRESAEIGTFFTRETFLTHSFARLMNYSFTRSVASISWKTCP